MSDNTIISLSHVCKYFGTGENKTVALNDVSLEVNKGEFVSIMGPSGCGKSTLLYLISGLDNPTSGKILFDGKDVSILNDKQKSLMRSNELGFVFQFYNLVQNLTVEENIFLPLVMSGKNANSQENRNRLKKIIDDLSLTGKEKSFPSELSGGQQQRVSIARSLINNPKLILADEPTGSLDSKNGKNILEIFKNINRELGVSIIMVTHSEVCSSYASRLITMHDGTVLNDKI